MAFTFIFSAYGFWLPNDPRGSWSECIRRFDLLQFGEATKVTTARSLAVAPHDEALRYPPVIFTGLQAAALELCCAIRINRMKPRGSASPRARMINKENL